MTEDNPIIVQPTVQLRFEDPLERTKSSWPVLKIGCDPYLLVQKGDVLRGLATHSVTDRLEEMFPDAFRDGMVVADLTVKARVWDVSYGSLVGTSQPTQYATLTLWVAATNDMVSNPHCGGYAGGRQLSEAD